MVDRREFLRLSLIGAAVAGLPACGSAAVAATGARKMLFVIQRGAADGLAALAPIGDPAFAGLRGALADEAARGHKIESDFALHPKLSGLASMYGAGDALFVHAVATPYRARSHFDGQNILESGAAKPYSIESGWLNRLVGELGGVESVAIAQTVPLAMRGDVDVGSYTPSRLPEAGDDLLVRIGDLYAQDAELAPIWNEAMQLRASVGEVARGNDGKSMGALAAKLMQGAEGARIAMVESEGWDTHQNQKGRLDKQFGQLDALLDSFKAGMGAEWADTLVVVATEFGRTAAINGTGGTDHGTASLAMLVGGAVSGGKMVGDFPGLRSLYEGRDLMPTMDLDSLILGAVTQHFALDEGRLSPLLFPETRPKALQAKLIG